VRPSLFLQAALRLLFPLLLVTSGVVMWRGHQLPGGGFLGGLIASSALVLRELAFARTTGLSFGALKLSPRYLIVGGLTLSALSSLVAPLSGKEFMQGVWIYLPVIGDIGTPVAFDVGVYFTVIGVVSSILLPLIQEAKVGAGD